MCVCVCDTTNNNLLPRSVLFIDECPTGQTKREERNNIASGIGNVIYGKCANIDCYVPLGIESKPTCEYMQLPITCHHSNNIISNIGKSIYQRLPLPGLFCVTDVSISLEYKNRKHFANTQTPKAMFEWLGYWRNSERTCCLNGSIDRKSAAQKWLAIASINKETQIKW